MNNEWKSIKLGDICSIKGGKRLPKGSSLTTDKTKHPYIRIRDMYQHKYIENNGELEFVDEDTFKTISNYIVNSGDVIIAIVGNTIGLVSLIGKSLDNASLTENCVKLINLDGCLSEYIYYYLNSEKGQNQIKSKIVGTSQPKLPIYGVKDIEIALPKLDEQKKIIDILSSLDKKIEINNKINKKLEEMAQAIFKKWFVDFEFPNEEGKPYKSSGGEMVEGELGMIPKGWEVVKLKDIGNLTMGLSPKSESYNAIGEGTPLLNGAADFYGGLIKATKYTTKETRVCKKNDLVFCIRATIGNITFADKEYCLGRGVASIESKKNLYVGIIYMNLSRSIERLKAQATGSVILGLSKPDINDMKLILPTKEILNKYSDIFKNAFDKKHILELENRKI